MKSIRTLFSALILVLAVSACQNADVNGNAQFAENRGLATLKVKIANNATRLAFEQSGNVLKRQFAVDDELIGCTKVDDTYKNFTYKVQSVEVNGSETVLTLVKTEGEENVPSKTEGTLLHFIYAPGHASSDISAEGALKLDISNQTDGNIPAVMTADGIVASDGTVTLSFSNLAAVVEIDPSQFTLEGVGSNPYTFSSVCVAGVMTEGTLTAGDSGFEFVPGDAAGKVTVSPADGGNNWDKDSKVYAALLPSTGSDIDVSLNVTYDNAVGSFFTTPIHSDVTANGYYSVAGAKKLELKAVAQSIVNGTTYYHTTLADAAAFANDAESDVTVTMINDAVLEKYVTFKNENSAVVTLDLNNCRISCDDAESSRTIYVTSGELVIEDSGNDGTVFGTNSAVTANKGKLTINGGNFVGGGYTSAGSGVVYSYGEGSKLTINGGTITCQETGNAGRAINVTVACEINGGTINCEAVSGYAFRTYNTCETVIDGENVFIYSIGSNGALYSGSSTATGIFRNGYIYGGEKTNMISNSARFAVQGGHFNKSVTPADGYECVEDAVTAPDGRNYTHTVVERVSNSAEVNGVGYKTMQEAYDTAMATEGAVTIKLLNDWVVTERCTFNKVDNAGTTLDLNGNNISTTVDSVFTPMKNLTITDNTGTGVITSNKSQVITMNNSSIATVTISDCTITSTATNTNLNNAILRSTGKSADKANRVFNITGNAKIIGYHIGIYIQHGTVNISGNAEVTATRDFDQSAAIYVNTGANYTISESASLKGYNAMRSGTSNSASNVNINGGYFYANGANGKIVLYTSTYDARFFFNGGYFNILCDKTLCPNATFSKSPVALDPAVTHSHGGETLTYNYVME